MSERGSYSPQLRERKVMHEEGLNVVNVQGRRVSEVSEIKPFSRDGVWSEGVRAYLNKDYIRARDLFKSAGNSSKMMFNIALCLSAVDDHEDVATLTVAISQDPHFALAYFARGVGFYKQAL